MAPSAPLRHREQAEKKEGGRAYFQMMTFSAGTYFAFPIPTLQSTLVVFSGVGILMTTLFADSFGGKLALTCTV